MANNNWFTRNIRKRNLIKKNEDKISYMQIIGFGLVASGIIYMTAVRIITHVSSPEGMAISFFIIMLGMAFAFPSLLKGYNKDLSTMRIVVFMMVNVICLLLIKIGWASDIKSLGDIGLNQYWMGVIAFIFGAKAAQSYFESKLAAPGEKPKTGMAALEYSNADIAKLAVEQNQQYLKVKFPNILSVSDAVHDLNQTESHVIALYLKDDKTIGIPDKLEVKMPDGSVKTIATEVIKTVGPGKIQANQLDRLVTNDNSTFGSICCMVKLPQNNEAIVTSGHLFSRSTPFNAGGFLNSKEKVLLNQNGIIGNWLFQLITSTEDIALVELSHANSDPQCKTFSQKGLRTVSEKDIKTAKPNVTLLSNVSAERDAFLLDFNTTWQVPYKGEAKLKSNIILVGSINDRETSLPVSVEGDSGGCVFHKDSGSLIGIILGRNDKYTWVLPLKETFDFWEFSLI